MKRLEINRIYFSNTAQTELFEFCLRDGTSCDYGYVATDMLLEDARNKHYGSFYFVAKQLKIGPEDVEDIFNKWKEANVK